MKAITVPTTLPSNGKLTESTPGSSMVQTPPNLRSNLSSTFIGNDLSRGKRETGVIENLSQFFGFIQCLERKARLYFHHSQFTGNYHNLNIGDGVEFEMTYDPRNNKPIAGQVSKIVTEEVSGDRITGTVTNELNNNSSTSFETTRRISFMSRGVHFFLPYSNQDVEGNKVNLTTGDKVSFQIGTNRRGNLCACRIRLENTTHPVKYRGIVSYIQEPFGYIERADVKKDISFHFVEVKGRLNLTSRDNVEFTIGLRKGREVAFNVKRLPPGTVVLEDIDTAIFRGQVIKALETNNPVRLNKEHLQGRICYHAPDYSAKEVPFGFTDQKGPFTLRRGDLVHFSLATDRRDRLKRATSIVLLDETFDVSWEKREQGIVASVEDGFGYICCAERSMPMIFYFTEVLDTERQMAMYDEVEFTVVQESGDTYHTSTGLCAIRIKHLPPKTVQFQKLIVRHIEGIITHEAQPSISMPMNFLRGGGITYKQDGSQNTIKYFLKYTDERPRLGDAVLFDIYMDKQTKELMAVNVQPAEPVRLQKLRLKEQENSQEMLDDGNQEHVENAQRTDESKQKSCYEHVKAVFYELLVREQQLNIGMTVVDKAPPHLI